MIGRTTRGFWALGLSAALVACGSDEPEAVNPIPGTEIELLTADGLNHGPVMEVTLDDTALTVSVGDEIYVKAMGVFGDGYMTDVTEHTYFQAAGGIAIKPAEEGGVPVFGQAAGTGQITLILGSLVQPTIDVEVEPVAAINAPSDVIARRNSAYPLTTALQFEINRGTATDDVSADAEWTSSDEAVATVSSQGVVTGLTDGAVTITATYDDDGLERTTSRDFTVACDYPAAGDLVRAFQTLPLIEWTNAFFPADPATSTPITSGPLSTKDLYCGDNGLDGYRGVFFQISAEWCVPCRQARQFFTENRAVFESNSILPIFSEIEDRSFFANMTSEDANQSMSRELPDDFGIRIGDLDANNIFNDSNENGALLVAFPTMIVVRLDDMKVIASSRNQHSEFFDNFDQIFENLDWSWEDIVNPGQ